MLKKSQLLHVAPDDWTHPHHLIFSNLTGDKVLVNLPIRYINISFYHIFLFTYKHVQVITLLPKGNDMWQFSRTIQTGESMMASDARCLTGEYWEYDPSFCWHHPITLRLQLDVKNTDWSPPFNAHCKLQFYVKGNFQLQITSMKRTKRLKKTTKKKKQAPVAHVPFGNNSFQRCKTILQIFFISYSS